MVESGFGRKDYSVKAEAALRSTFVDKCLLKRVRLLRRAEPLEGGDFVLPDCVHRRHTRTYGAATYDDGACSTLRQTAPELRTMQPKLVAENEQERG